MKFRPLHDNVLVKRLEAAEEKSVESSFLIRPKKSRRKAMSWRWVLGNSGRWYTASRRGGCGE